MKSVILLIGLVLSLPVFAQQPWYFGTNTAVNLTNSITYKNGVMNIAGSLDPSAVAVNAPKGSLYESTNGKLYIKQDAGSTTNWFPVSAGPAGSPLTFAGFNASGDLYSVPTWTIVPETSGLYSNANTPATSETDLRKIELNTYFGDGVSGDADSFYDLYILNSTNANYDLTKYGVIYSNFNQANGATVQDVSLLDMSYNGNISGNAVGINTFYGGDNTDYRGVQVGMNGNTNFFQGYSTSFNGDSSNDAYGYYTSQNGNITNFYTGFRMDKGGTANGMYGIALVSSADITNQSELVNLSNSGHIFGNIFGVNFGNNGDVDGNFTGVGIGNNGVIGNLTGFNFGNNNTGTFDNFNGVNIYNNANGAAGANLNAYSIQNSGSVENFGGYGANNTGSVNSNINLLALQDSSNSPTANAGSYLNFTGTYNNVTALNIDVGSATSANRKTGLAVQGGSIQSTVPFTTTSSLPSVVDGGNNIISMFTVNSGSPITDTSVIGNNFSGLANFHDDYDGDPFYNLGYTMVGFVGQVGVDSGKTVDKVNMALAGASVPPSSTGGTINEAVMYNAMGILPAGGTINVNTLFGFRGEASLCDLATDCYGISIEETTADNYISKSLQIGGTQAPITNDVALKVGSKKAIELTPMTTAEKTALSVNESAIVYDDTLNLISYWDGATWQNLSAGSGITQINSQAGPSITLQTGTGNTDFTISAAANVITFDLPTADGTHTGKLLNTDWTNFNNKVSSSSGSSTDNHLVRWDGTTGKIIQDGSTAVLSDAGGLSGLTLLDVDNLELDANTISSTNANGNIILNPNGTGQVNLPDLTASLPLKLDSSKNVVSAAIDLSGSEVTNVLPLSKGGTNKNMTAVNGGVVWTDADSQEVTAAGTAGQVLQSNGAAAPTWVNPSSVAGTFAYTAVSSLPYTALSTDFTICVSGASGTINLPTAVGNQGRVYKIKHCGTSLSQVYTIDPNGAQTIDGFSTYPLYTNSEALEFQSDNANWIKLQHDTGTPVNVVGTIGFIATTTNPTKGTIVVDEYTWYRKGREINMTYNYQHSTAGNGGSGVYFMPLVTNASPDTTNIYKIVNGSTTNLAGAASTPLKGRCLVTNGVANSIAVDGVPELDSNNSGYFKISGLSGGGSFITWANGTANPWTSSNMTFSCTFSYVVNGWRD